MNYWHLKDSHVQLSLYRRWDIHVCLNFPGNKIMNKNVYTEMGKSSFKFNQHFILPLFSSRPTLIELKANSRIRCLISKINR